MVLSLARHRCTIGEVGFLSPETRDLPYGIKPCFYIDLT